MKTNLTQPSAAPGTLDQILASEEAIVPSSGFALSVMDAIRSESTEPAPIPFPWPRLLPGAVIALALLVWISWSIVGELATWLHSTNFNLALTGSIALTPQIAIAGWLLLALASALIPLLMVRRFMGNSALF
jgi:hypothetical protein